MNQSPVILIFILAFTISLFGEGYPDGHFQYRDMQKLYVAAEEISAIKLSDDGTAIELTENSTDGYIVFAPDSSNTPFNEGLPSWNGFALRNGNAAFAVQMRFPLGNGWSPWVTVGFWKDFIWNSYGSTSWSGGKVNIDIVELGAYQNQWQFKVLMKRKSLADESPRINKLSFFVSDSRTTDNFNVIEAVADKPAPIFIETEFYYQYGLDDEIGGSICSPTSVAMILRSYDIELDPVQFARDNKDPYWGIFGVWPRVVQNAAEFGLDGAVTRYRNWSDAREVLANGGRIAISVGPPLYSGHLMMLAGFNDNGTPIIHDPARSNGYAYVFNKSDLSRSWFQKGGVSYTFYLKDSTGSTAIGKEHDTRIPEKHQRIWNYPNPFNNATKIEFTVETPGVTALKIFDLRGRCVFEKNYQYLSEGKYHFTWNAGKELSSGWYTCKIINHSHVYHTSMLYLK